MLNRAALFSDLQAELEAGSGDGRVLGLLMLRVRRVREIGLLLGYEVAEAFVDAVEAAIVAAVRPRDRAWRVGDGDFAVVLPALHDRNHAALAAAKLLRVLQHPLEAAGQRVLPVVAVGVATAPHDAADARNLCRCADQACEDAGATSERFAFYQSQGFAAAFPHTDLGEAIAANRLELFLQPIADLDSGRFDRCEALARWTHPTFGPIAPDLFVRVAEQTGLIPDLTRWSLNVSLRHIAEAMRKAGNERSDRVPSVAVNIAVGALQHPGFVEQVFDQLRFWDVPADRLVLEITESGLMEHPAQCERLLQRLREHGLSVAIDDFGTGYSSMAYLRRLPVNELKIDRSFVQDMREDARARKLVGSMIDLSHHLGMRTVAEGVEDAETLALLQSLDCDYAQGFHLGRPAPAGQVMASLTALRAA